VSFTPGRPLVARPGIDPLSGSLQQRQDVSTSLSDWPRTTRLLPWTLAAFLAMMFLVPFDNTNLPIPLPLDATLDRPLLFCLVVLWAVSISTLVGVRRLGVGPVHWAFAAFGAVAVASILLNFETLNLLGQVGPAVKKLALLFSYGLLFLVAASSLRASEVPRFTAYMVGLASVMAVGVIVEYRTGFNAFYAWGGSLIPGVTPPEDLGGYDSIGRLTVVGPGGHPLAAAVMLSLVLPFAIVGVLRSRERRTKLLYALAAALMIGGAVATQRKTSFIVPAVALTVLAAYRPRQALRLLPLGVVLAVLIAGLAPGALQGVVDQMKPSALTGVLTTKDRISDYDAILPEIVSRPLTGRGYESYDQKRYRILDNQYLTLAVNVGFLGLLGYLAIMASAFWLAHRCSRSDDPERRWFGPAAAAAIVGIAIGSALLDTLALPQLPYLFCMIAALTAISAGSLPNGRTARRETFSS
jgi:O-antigen ligase/polysaccharide polymerase Wzy-like membrane protein